MFSKLRRIYFVDLPRPTLQDGEDILAEGTVAYLRGSRFGRLILTNRRVIWDESTRAWLLKPISGELRLRDVATVEKTNILLSFFRGGPLRLRLLSGESKHFFVAKTDDWITTFRQALAGSKQDRSA